MIFFNWVILAKSCKGNVFKMLDYFTAELEGRVITKPHHRAAKAAKRKDSFIIDPIPLIRNKDNATDMERYIYLQLAAMRPYGSYRERKYTGLPLYAVEYDPRKLKHNRLLEVTSEDIKFKYER